MNYKEKLKEYLEEEGGYVDFLTRVEPVLMVNGEVFFSRFGKNQDERYKSHTAMLCALIEDEKIDINLHYDYGYHRQEEEIEEEDVIECFAYGHVVLDHEGNEIVVWEYETIKSYESTLQDAISQSNEGIEHFFISRYNRIDTLIDFETFCNGNY